MHRQTKPVKPDITRDIMTVLRMQNVTSSSVKATDIAKLFQVGTLMRMIKDIPRDITMAGTWLLEEITAELIRVQRALETAAKMIQKGISRYRIII
jgi:hypothetical protein